MEKRSDIRIPTQLVATIKQNSKQKSVEVRDYSQGGMFLSFINNLKLIDIHGSLTLEAGMLCTIDVDQANSVEQCADEISVEVIRTDQYGAGVKFKDNDAADFIKKLFEKILYS